MKPQRKSSEEKTRFPQKYVLLHYNVDEHKFPIVALGVFDTEDKAVTIASDDDVMNHYGGTLDDGDFYIDKIPFNVSLEEFKKFHEI